jgi:rRNA maturation protein Nop10
LRFKCPHCGKETISVYDKLRFNPRVKIKCQECGGYVNIPFYVSLIDITVMLLVVFGMKGALKIEWIFVIIALVSYLVISTLIVVFYVPIVKK